ncbi:glycosyltransferase [Cellulosimicrobium sp. Marseille-Q4280]|uniref:glycosyltransferase n=1 Tax=Cellulosimicrobium sp. Marseille-Q4280 TaxID=2937992 RepID=UPI00203E21CD|nr:glycosyltransferase [Cellulosimicrobium sp. Marseille-Q4280]
MSAAHDRPLRVLVLDHTAELGGAELALVRACEALGDDVEVRALLFADGELRGRLEEVGVQVEIVPLSGSVVGADRARAARLSPWTVVAALRTVPFLWHLARRVRALRPDVVHSTSLKADLLALVPARAARRPLVWHVHDRIATDYLPSPLVHLVRGLSRVPSAVVVNSRATAATLPVPTAVAYPGFAPDQAAALGTSGEPQPGAGPVVVLVGRLSATKGQLETVRALRALVDDVAGVRLRLVGEPAFGAESYAAQVRDEVRALGLEDRVELVGFVPDTRAELDRATVCVHASPVPEPFGQVVVEAMVRGVPVVATRAGGVEEILLDDVQDPEQLGLLVPPGDVPALAAALREVLTDPEAARERAERARTSALRRFPAARTAEVLTQVWNDVSGRRPHA